MLKDPLSGMPVIVVEKNSLLEIIPNNIIENLSNMLEGKNVDLEDEVSQEYISKFRMIPFSSLGKQNRIINWFYSG